MQKVFHVKRNTVSTYLNQLVKENLVIKINTRPVYFLSRSVFEKKFFNIPASILDSFQELKEYEPPKNDKKAGIGKRTGKRNGDGGVILGVCHYLK